MFTCQILDQGPTVIREMSDTARFWRTLKEFVQEERGRSFSGDKLRRNRTVIQLGIHSSLRRFTADDSWVSLENAHQRALDFPFDGSSDPRSEATPINSSAMLPPTLHPQILIILSSLLVGGTLEAAATTRRKLSANETFFNGAFVACKGTKPSNPVEAVRAHVYATKLFNAFQYKDLLGLASRLQVPLFAVYPFGDFACTLNLLIYAALSKGTEPILPLNFPIEQYFSFAMRVIDSAESGSLHLTLRHKGKMFKMPWSTVRQFASLLFPALRKATNGHSPRDVNHVLHAIEYFRSLFR